MIRRHGFHCITPSAYPELAQSKYPEDLGKKERRIGHMITHMDMIVGKFLTKVKQIGQEENTLVIFTGNKRSVSQFRVRVLAMRIAGPKSLG